MRGLLKRFAAPVAAMSLLVGAGAAGAATVSFHTLGGFTTDGTTTGNIDGTATAVSVTASGNVLTVGGETLTFTGSTIVNQFVPDSGTITGTNFGAFSLAGSTQDDFSNVGFSVNIYQDVPAPLGGSPQGTFVGSLQGYVGLTNGNLTVTFAPPTSFVVSPAIAGNASFTYKIPTPQVLNMIGADQGLAGQVAVAPLPATASTGLALLGGLGLLTGVSVLRRRRQMA